MPKGKSGRQVTVEHLLHLDDEQLAMFLPQAQSIFLGDGATVHKLGIAIMTDKTESKFRPITILDALKKCVDGEIMRRLLRLLYDWGLLRQEQDGFTVGGSIETPVELMARLYEHALANGRELHVVMLDLMSAYDSVNWLILDIAMRRLHLSEAFIR